MTCGAGLDYRDNNAKKCQLQSFYSTRRPWIYMDIPVYTMILDCSYTLYSARHLPIEAMSILRLPQLPAPSLHGEILDILDGDTDTGGGI